MKMWFLLQPFAFVTKCSACCETMARAERVQLEKRSCLLRLTKKLRRKSCMVLNIFLVSSSCICFSLLRTSTRLSLTRLVRRGPLCNVAIIGIHKFNVQFCHFLSNVCDLSSSNSNLLGQLFCLRTHERQLVDLFPCTTCQMLPLETPWAHKKVCCISFVQF